ncbi:NUDIX hydrolase [Hydrogenoanaerobacterium sp.]|uniref:NUDIX hydrolase n=1 Tax=Hydrogenoanaerobacterium sp. TaxID=2953763 RepID=UPI00289CBC34|nr:NUDIX hydrolase [Hydrogenoanaerobacterium sp.]
MNYIDQIREFIPLNEQEKNDKRVILDYIELFPHNILTRENEFAHITSSGLILNPALDRVLLIHHNIYNAWAWTGGHADGDIDLLEIALKEAREETGLHHVRPLTEQLLTVDILPVYGHVKRGSYVCSHQHLNGAYVLLADEEEELAIKPDENSAVRWFDTDQLAQVVSEPYFMEIYQKIIDRARAL